MQAVRSAANAYGDALAQGPGRCHVQAALGANFTPLLDRRSLPTVDACGDQKRQGGPIRSGSLEAAPGFEPGMEDLQSSALPLGHAALLGRDEIA